MKLANWAEQVIAVEQDGTSVERVRLLIDGETYATWGRQEFDPEKALEFLNGILDELPVRAIEGAWVAETADGVTRAQLPQALTGRSRRAGKAAETTAEVHARVTTRLLDAQMGQVQQQAETIELLLRNNRSLMEQLTQNQPTAGQVLAASVANEVAPILKELPELLKATAYFLGPKER